VGLWLIIEASRSHSLDTPQSIRFLWTSDQPDAVTFTRHHKTLTRKTGTHVPVGTRSRNPRKWATAYPRLRERATGIGNIFNLLFKTLLHQSPTDFTGWCRLKGTTYGIIASTKSVFFLFRLMAVRPCVGLWAYLGLTNKTRPIRVAVWVQERFASNPA